MFSNKFKLLDWYIIRKFIGSFVGVIGLVVIVVLVVDIAENIQGFLDREIGLFNILFGYYSNFIPYFVNLLSPLFVFIAVIYFTSKLSRNSEIIAMLNCGMSFYRLMAPYIFSAVLIGLLSFYLTNFLIPHTQRNLMLFKEKFMSSQQVRSKDVDTHIKIAPNTYVYVHYWDNQNLTGYNFWYEQMDANGVKYKIYARTIAWDSVKKHWSLFDFVKRNMNGLAESAVTGSKMDTVFNLSIADFVYVREDWIMMNFSEIRKFINEEKEKGSTLIKNYEFEKHRRIAFPFSTIILAMIGLSVSSRKSREGVGLHLLSGLLITFSFVMLMQFSQVFAIYGGFSSFWAAWTPNIIYAGLSAVLIKFTPK